MTWIERDLKVLWHPCSQMKDYMSLPPLPIRKAEGCHLILDSGKPIIDAISSWWCKILGHQHPKLKEALIRQAEIYDHVILANTSQQPSIELSEKLLEHFPGFGKVMYASDGSCGVEIALKLSLHTRAILGQTQKTQLMHLKNSYHGETLLALSVSDLGLYTQAYEPWLSQSHTIIDIPYVSGSAAPSWDNCPEEIWQKVKTFIECHASTTTALILEPLVQGAGGMQIYSADFLKRLRKLTTQHNIHLIADEIMTGFFRTGAWSASELAKIIPDVMVLGKGLTAGWLPLSAVLIRENWAQLFYEDYSKGKNFLHSHTHSGNALACAVALETIKIFEKNDKEFKEYGKQLENLMREKFLSIEKKTGLVKNIRTLGLITAADLVEEAFQHHPRPGFEVYKKAIELGALLRPLGNTIYWLPPICIEPQTIHELTHITEQALNFVSQN